MTEIHYLISLQIGEMLVKKFRIQIFSYTGSIIVDKFIVRDKAPNFLLDSKCATITIEGCSIITSNKNTIIIEEWK